MIAFLIIVYTAVVVVLFKVLHIKPTAYVIASMIVAGVFMIGGVVVVWTQAAPITDKMVTSQYVVQLVPYVKGQVKAVHAQALQPMKKGDLLLEIDPAPYQYTVNQVEAQLNAAKATVKQAEASLQAANAAVVNAQANVTKAKAADELAKTQEQIALNIQRRECRRDQRAQRGQGDARARGGGRRRATSRSRRHTSAGFCATGRRRRASGPEQRADHRSSIGRCAI